MDNRQKNRVLQILHTNDVHSRFPEMARIFTGFKKWHEEARVKGYSTVKVDLGDQMDRMYIKTEATWGQANIDVMNAMGYRWATIGNNEGLTFPREKFDQLYERAQFQVLCANMVDSSTDAIPPHLKPYAIETYEDGFSVGWIGVTAPYHRFYCLLGLKPLNPREMVQEILVELKGKVDFVVLLSHLGYNADVALAKEVTGIHLILGSHTHTLLPEGERVGDTLICQTGKFGEFFGKVEIRYNENHEIIDSSAICIPSSHYAPDPGLCAIVEQQETLSERILDIEVAHLPHGLPISWVEESPLGNLLAIALKGWVGADLGIVNSGALLSSLPKGTVTKKDLLKLCPHPINPCKMELTGAQLKEIFEEALFSEVIYRELRGFGFRGKVIGWLNVVGAHIHYDPRGHKGKRIKEIWVGQNLMQDEQTYTIGTVDMFTFGVVFPTFKKGEGIQFYFPEFLRDVLQAELGNKESIQACHNRWWIPQ